MVFVAFFELFEWSAASLETTYILQFNLNMCNNFDFFATLEAKSLFMYLILFIKRVYWIFFF
jgi:hypothetical protein